MHVWTNRRQTAKPETAARTVHTIMAMAVTITGRDARLAARHLQVRRIIKTNGMRRGLKAPALHETLAMFVKYAGDKTLTSCVDI